MKLFFFLHCYPQTRLFCFFLLWFCQIVSFIMCPLTFNFDSQSNDRWFCFFFMNLKSAGTNGYSGNILLYLWCLTQVKVTSFPSQCFCSLKCNWQIYKLSAVPSAYYKAIPIHRDGCLMQLMSYLPCVYFSVLGSTRDHPKPDEHWVCCPWLAS